MSSLPPLPSTLSVNMATNKQTALNYARAEYSKSGRLVIWVDGSVRNIDGRRGRGSPSVTSFAWKVVHDDGETDWADEVMYHDDDRQTEPREAEIWGVMWCLHRMVDQIFKQHPRMRAAVNTIVIYTDCMDATEKISQQPGGYRVRNWDWANAVVVDIYKMVERLEGLDVEINWVPAHEGIEGNEWANFVAQKANGVPSSSGGWGDQLRRAVMAKKWRERNERDERRRRMGMLTSLPLFTGLDNCDHRLEDGKLPPSQICGFFWLFVFFSTSPSQHRSGRRNTSIRFSFYIMTISKASPDSALPVQEQLQYSPLRMHVMRDLKADHLVFDDTRADGFNIYAGGKGTMS